MHFKGYEASVGHIFENQFFEFLRSWSVRERIVGSSPLNAREMAASLTRNRFAIRLCFR